MLRVLRVLRVLKVLGVLKVLNVLNVLNVLKVLSVRRVPRGVLTTAVVALLPLCLAAREDAGQFFSAEDLIVTAVRARVGQAEAEVVVTAIDAGRPIGGRFRSVRLDPGAVLGKPMRLTLVPATGLPLIAVASVRVTAEHVVAARDINRGETLTDGDVLTRRDEIRGIPLRRLPTPAEVRGGRTLRAVPAGSVFLPGAVVLRRIVEPGDELTVVARAGDAEVSAVMVAADGGDPGDVIRVSNPDTRRQLRGRVQQSGVVEVLHVR